MDSFFRAIGVISGKVSALDARGLQIEIAGQFFELLPGESYGVFYSLLKTVKKRTTCGHPNRLIVYPRVYLSKYKPVEFKFSIVSYDTDLLEELEPGEFLLSGLWQFVPNSKLPVVSIYRNQAAQLDPKSKKDFVHSRAQHIPLQMELSVEPYRYRRSSSGSKVSFIEIKARFNAQHKIMEGVEQLGPSTQNIPAFSKQKKMRHSRFSATA